MSTTIAQALFDFIEDRVTGREKRLFFRLDGFDDITYVSFLEEIKRKAYKVGALESIVRTTKPLPGFESFQLDENKSATWYRNNVQIGQVLILVFNETTTDKQSLQNIYPISESSLTAEGLRFLIKSAFQDSAQYALTEAQIHQLELLVRDLEKHLFQPQLRDLASFLEQVHSYLVDNSGSSIQEAIAHAFPEIGLFRARRFADLDSLPQRIRLLRANHTAAQLGYQVIEDKKLNEYLAALDDIQFYDDIYPGGISRREKSELLRLFLQDVLRNRAKLLRVLHIDWSEVEPILHKRKRKTKAEKLQELGQALKRDLEQNGFDISDLETLDAQETLRQLQQGQEPIADRLDALLSDTEDKVDTKLQNQIKRLRGTRKLTTSDFPAGLVRLIVDLLLPLQNTDENYNSFSIKVNFDDSVVDIGKNAEVVEALAAFYILHAGIQSHIPVIHWNLDSDLWDLVEEFRESASDIEETILSKHEQLVFTVEILSESSERIAFGELTWIYGPDSPEAVTLHHLHDEATLQHQVPIYNVCEFQNSIGDLDLNNPIRSIGTWFRNAKSLRDFLEHELKNIAEANTWPIFEHALSNLERCWHDFIAQAREQGILSTDLTPLIEAYQALLENTINLFHSQVEARAAFRLIVQAWMVGETSFDRWGMMPFLHPLKLQWWQARLIHYNSILDALISETEIVTVVDEKGFKRDLYANFQSNGHPALVALPDKDKRCSFLLPITEVRGYELFGAVDKANITYGLDADLIEEDGSEQTVAVTAIELARVVEDYVETYPFVRNGLEIYLLNCRNGALPGALLNAIQSISDRKGWQLRANLIVHTEDRGAPIYRRVLDWIENSQEVANTRARESYFPNFTVKVLECPAINIVSHSEDTDLVILADVLAEQGQSVKARQIHQWRPIGWNDYLQNFRPRPEPQQHKELSRYVSITPKEHPAFLQLFYDVQWGAENQSPVRAKHEFRLEITLSNWESLLISLHEHFNWVVCYDPTIDRHLIEANLGTTNAVDVIKYATGLGQQQRHNLTVSSSSKARTAVVRRLIAQLNSIIPDSYKKREQIAYQLVEEANIISGDIVLRAAGPGLYLNELIGITASKHLTETNRDLKDSLQTWIYLDDFAHWFERKMPDLLFVQIVRGATGRFTIYLHVIESKCVGKTSFNAEAKDAEKQLYQGVNRLERAFHKSYDAIDKDHWYRQLYGAVAGNLIVNHDEMLLWEEFQKDFDLRSFDVEIIGHTWIFCYDGAVGANPIAEGTIPTTTEFNTPMYYHHYGSTALIDVLNVMISEPSSLPLDIATSPIVAATEPAQPHPEVPSPVSETIAEYQLQSIESTSDEIYSTSDPDNIDENEGDLSNWIEEKARELRRAMRDFGIETRTIKSEDADIGSSVVRFKVELQPGEKTARLQNIDKDLQRVLSLNHVPIIQNVSGTPYVGIDLPRPELQTYSVLDYVNHLTSESDQYLPFLVGTTPDGNVRIADFKDLKHLLVAGSTGSGKTIFLYSLLVSLIAQFNTEALQLMIIDPKQTDFIFFEQLKHLLEDKVIIEPEESIEMLQLLTEKTLQDRTNLLRDAETRDIQEYNTKNPENPIAPIVVMIDEYADLVQVLGKSERDEFERQMVRLAQRARNVGIHLIIATQRPSADIVTSKLKSNLPGRIAFQLPSYHDSNTILDESGAQNLIGRGDMLFKIGGNVQRLQGFYISTDDLRNFLTSFKV